MEPTPAARREQVAAARTPSERAFRRHRHGALPRLGSPAPKRGLAQWITWTVQRSGAASASVPDSAPRVSASMPAKGGSSTAKPVLAALT